MSVLLKMEILASVGQLSFNCVGVRTPDPVTEPGPFDDLRIKRRGWKTLGSSATGSILIDERQRRNKKRKQAKQARKRNR